MRMFGNILIFIIYFCYVVNFSVVCRISNERRCVDPDCSVPISLARTMIRYSADDDRILSFSQNAKAKIFSKEAGNRLDLWEAEINGKRGYVPKEFIREEKILVKPSEVKYIVPTGEIEKSKHNTTQNNTETVTLNQTPKLPVDNSKGLFSNILGVSADSVPPNSPEINPQSTQKYEVVDGTTIAVYDDDQFIENFDESPQFEPPIKKPSHSESVPLLVKAADVEHNIKEDSSETRQTYIKKESSETNIKEESFEAMKTNIKEGSSGSTGTNIKENSESLKNNKKESVEGIENDNIDSSLNQDQSNVEIVNLENNKQELPEKFMKMADISQEKPKSIDQQDVDLIIGPTSESSLIGNVFNSVSNYISSGIREIEKEEEEEEKEEEKINNKDEFKEIENEGEKEEEEEKINHKDEFKPADQENDNNFKVEYSKNGDEITSPLVSEESNKNSLDSQINKTDEDNINVLETTNNVEDNSKNGIEEDEKSNEETDHLSNNDFDKLKNKNENLSNVFGGETVVLNETRVEVTEEVNLQITTDDTSAELDKNVTNETGDLLAQDKTDNTTSHSDISSIHEEIKIAEEDNSPNESIVISNDQTFLGQETPPPSANLEHDGPATVLTGEKDSSEVLTVPPVENLGEDNQINTQAPSLEVPSSFSSNPSVDSVLPQEHKNDSIDDRETKDKSNDIVDGLNMKPVYEEPETKHNIDHQPLFGSAQTENEKSEHPVINEAEKASAFNHAASDSPMVSLPLSSGPYTKPLEVPNDLSTPTPEKVSMNELSDEVVDSIEVVIKEGDSLQASANSWPDFLDEILNAEEEIKAKSSQLPPKHSILNQVNEINSGLEANEDSVLKEVSNSDSEGFFSWLKPIFELFKNSEIEQFDTRSDDSNEILKPETLDSLNIETVQVDGSCPSDKLGEGNCGFLNDVSVAHNVMGAESFKSPEMIATLIDEIPLDVTILLVITGVVVLIFSLGHYYIEAHRRDGPLVAVINKLEREVLILKKENSILEDRLQTVLQELESWNTNSAENDALIVELKQELEETKSAKQELEEQVTVLEREVESVTENGLEIHRLLEESLSSQDGSQVLLSTVETLREKLEHQEDEIAALSQRLSQKNMEVEELEKKLANSLEVSAELEERVIAVTRNKEEEALQLKDTHRQLIAQLEEVMETKALDETRVSTEMSKLRLAIEELQKIVAEKDAELEEVKEVVKQLRSTDSNDKMDALFDVVGIRAQLRTALTERDDFREKFHDEEGARKLLEGHMKKITQEVAELKVSFETAEKEKIEALTKLQVLSNYFKEKESQLQKELGVQESMWLQKQSDDHTIYEQMRSLREENEKYKLQNESLKKEIVEQESSFKIQIANVEQKSHENWVASRQAERRLKEVQQEAAQLRNRLTMEKNSANYSMEDGKPISESNGDPSSPPPSLMYPPTSSPPFMMYPMPPPGDFVPPPPLMGSPYPSDSRPPPLGRISSPPLDPRFSPPPPLPYPPFDYPSYGHHSPSPPPPLPSHSHHRNVHKPQPRELSREQKEHVMSSYSPEGDNTVRKNKR